MAPNQVTITPENDADVAPLHGTLEGTFHHPQMPPMPMNNTYYVPHMQSSFPNYPNFTGSYIIGAPAYWTGAPPAMTFPYMIDIQGQRWDISSYTECKADSGVDQINGVVIICDVGSNNEDVKAPQGKYYYTSCKKYGPGSQVNGVEVVYHGASQAPAAPAMPGYWDRIEMLNVDGRDTRGQVRSQVNGSRVRVMKRSEMGASL